MQKIAVFFQEGHHLRGSDLWGSEITKKRAVSLLRIKGKVQKSIGQCPKKISNPLVKSLIILLKYLRSLREVGINRGAEEDLRLK